MQAHETLRQDRRLSKEHVEREEQELVVIIVQDLQQLHPACIGDAQDLLPARSDGVRPAPKSTKSPPTSS